MGSLKKLAFKYDAPPILLIDSTMNRKGENSGRTRSWGTPPGSQHFGGRGACQSSRIWIRKNDKQVNYSHEPIQTKQQVGQCVVGAFLLHGRTRGKHGLTRLTMAQAWGKPPPFPLEYSLCLATGLVPKCHFVLGLPSWESRNSQNWDFCDFGGP